jgi:hypothetical protein
MTVIVPERKVWSRQPQNALELKPEYSNLFTSLSVLSLPPRLGYDSAKNKFLPFTKSGSVTDSNPTAFGIGPKAGGTTSDYYSRTVSVTPQAMWMIAVFVPTVVDTNGKYSYALGSNAASAGAFIGITSGTGTQSNVQCTFRGLDGGAVISKVGPVPVVGKMMSVVFVCPSNVTSAAYMYVDGSFYNTAVTGDGDTTFTTTLVNEAIGVLKRGAVGGSSTDTVLLVGYGLGKIPAALAQKLSENPWQIFAPKRQLLYFGNTGQIDLAANATSVATSSGSLDLAQSLSAQAAAVASATGDITQATPLAGDALSSATASGTLSTSGGLTVDLASNAQAAAAAAGALYSAMALLGSASSVSAATGAIVDKTPPLAGSAIATATASATFYSEPKPVPAYRYAPGIAPTELLPLVTFIMTELYNIKSALDSVADGHLDKVYLPPTKPAIGDIRYADGSTWNPGSGQGIYYYNGSIWKLLG